MPVSPTLVPQYLEAWSTWTEWLCLLLSLPLSNYNQPVLADINVFVHNSFCSLIGLVEIEPEKSNSLVGIPTELGK